MFHDNTVVVDDIEVSTIEITLAVAAEVPDPKGGGRLVTNPYRFWDEISDRLPHRRIKIYGPPKTSGTRDSFERLCMAAATLKTRGYAGEYTNIRQDGVWVDSGENDNLIVRKLMRDVDAFGVFSFSFLEENQDKIQGARVDGVEVNFETISSGDYPLSRRLFFYIKKDHLKQVPGLYDYVRLFMAEEMIGENGQLTRLGLVPLPAQLREASRDRVMKLEPLTLREARLGTLDQYACQHGLVSE